MLISLRQAAAAWPLILCSATAALAQSPPNDDCAAAISLTVGAAPIGGSTVNATDSLASHSCTGSTFDVWYRFTAAAPGSFAATTNSSLSTPMSIIAFNACGGTELACIAANQNPTTLSFTVPTAGTYILRAAAFGGTPFAINIQGAVVGACCSPSNICSISSTGPGGCPSGNTYTGDNTSCSPDPCVGVCCRGATCNSTVLAQNCATSGVFAGAFFMPTASVCNLGGNTVLPCCYADYNKVQSVTVQDIFDYLNDWFSLSPFTRIAGDGAGAPTVQDIFDFLSAWFVGCH